MKFLIPTAKEMAKTKTIDSLSLPTESQLILEQITKLDSSELAKAYHIKPEMADKEWQRWQNMANNTATYSPAISLFNGLMYRQIKREQLSSDERNYLETAIFITSAFYGIIPAHFPIAEHRLDFNTSVKINGKSLKSLWKDHYDKFLTNCQEPVISLLSSEFEQVFSSKQRNNLIRVEFFEETADGTLKKHSTISKKARGQLIKAAIAQQVQSLELLKQLTFADFTYRDDLSTEQKLTFIKII